MRFIVLCSIKVQIPPFPTRSEYPKAISHKIHNFCVLGRRMHMVTAKFDECLASSKKYLSFALYWKYGRKYNYDTNHLRQLLLFCATKRNSLCFALFIYSNHSTPLLTTPKILKQKTTLNVKIDFI